MDREVGRGFAQRAHAGKPLLTKICTGDDAALQHIDQPDAHHDDRDVISAQVQHFVDVATAGQDEAQRLTIFRAPFLNLLAEGFEPHPVRTIRAVNYSP